MIAVAKNLDFGLDRIPEFHMVVGEFVEAESGRFVIDRQGSQEQSDGKS